MSHEVRAVMAQAKGKLVTVGRSWFPALSR